MWYFKQDETTTAEEPKFNVGHYAPNGDFIPAFTCDDAITASVIVNSLNGGKSLVNNKDNETPTE